MLTVSVDQLHDEFHQRPALLCKDGQIVVEGQVLPIFHQRTALYRSRKRHKILEHIETFPPQTEFQLHIAPVRNDTDSQLHLLFFSLNNDLSHFPVGVLPDHGSGLLGGGDGPSRILSRLFPVLPVELLTVRTHPLIGISLHTGTRVVINLTTLDI